VETSVGDESLPCLRLVGFGAEQLLIEFADLLNRGLQFLIIRQTTFDLRDLLLTEADLSRALAGVSDCEDGNGVTFAAVALRAAGAVADDAFEQGAAENVGGVGESRSEAIAFVGELFMFHYI
jgi:hypothetical protein